LSDELHGEAEKETLTISWNCGNFLDNIPSRYFFQLLFFNLTLAEDLSALFPDLKLDGGRIGVTETGQCGHGFFWPVFGG
jgi:hypothetical protein